MDKPLTCDKNRDGFYEWSNINNHINHFITLTKIPMQTWHNKLNHPYFKVLNFILNKIFIPSFYNNKYDFYYSCSVYKTQCSPFRQLTLSSNVPLKFVFNDLWGHHQLSLLITSIISASLFINISIIYGYKPHKRKVNSKRCSKSFSLS